MKLKSFSFFQGPTYNSLTSPPRQTMIFLKSAMGRWILARWLADSAARMSRRLFSPPLMRRRYISTVIIPKTNQASGSSTRVRNQPFYAQEELWDIFFQDHWCVIGVIVTATCKAMNFHTRRDLTLTGASEFPIIDNLTMCTDGSVKVPSQCASEPLLHSCNKRTPPPQPICKAAGTKAFCASPDGKLKTNTVHLHSHMNISI